jgi:tetratricopeptide (TPR) repeat protein
VLGKAHPDTAMAYNNIGMVYSKQGDYEKALEWNRKALVIFEKVLGKAHPDLAKVYNNIGLLYYGQGNYEKALAELLNAYRIQRQALKETHPETMGTKTSMETVYPKTALARQKPFAQWLEEALR